MVNSGLSAHRASTQHAAGLEFQHSASQLSVPTIMPTEQAHSMPPYRSKNHKIQQYKGTALNKVHVAIKLVQLHQSKAGGGSPIGLHCPSFLLRLHLLLLSSASLFSLPLLKPTRIINQFECLLVGHQHIV